MLPPSRSLSFFSFSPLSPRRSLFPSLSVLSISHCSLLPVDSSFSPLFSHPFSSSSRFSPTNPLMSSSSSSPAPSSSSPSSSFSRSSSDPWLSSEYSNYASHRTRPGVEMIERVVSLLRTNKDFPISLDDIKVVGDIGCGNGRFIPYLLQHFKSIKSVIAIDSSENMIVSGKKTIAKQVEEVAKLYQNDSLMSLPIGNLIRWQCDDAGKPISLPSPNTKLDFLFSNAALHWFPDHRTFIPSLLNNNLRSHGLFAIQMPNNFNENTHQHAINTYKQMFTEGKLTAEVLKNIEGKAAMTLSCKEYYEILREESAYCDIYEVNYHHTLVEKIPSPAEGKDQTPHHPFLTWILGSYLGPLLAEMPTAHHEEFIRRYVEKLHGSYPCWELSNEKGEKCLGTMVPFKRIFIIGIKK